MPSQEQYEAVKKKIESFRQLGCFTIFEIQPMSKYAAPKIMITNYVKSWRFCDPDWDVVIKQITMLYSLLEKSKQRLS